MELKRKCNYKSHEWNISLSKSAMVALAFKSSTEVNLKFKVRPVYRTSFKTACAEIETLSQRGNERKGKEEEKRNISSSEGK